MSSSFEERELGFASRLAQILTAPLVGTAESVSLNDAAQTSSTAAEHATDVPSRFTFEIDFDVVWRQTCDDATGRFDAIVDNATTIALVRVPAKWVCEAARVWESGLGEAAGATIAHALALDLSGSLPSIDLASILTPLRAMQDEVASFSASPAVEGALPPAPDAVSAHPGIPAIEPPAFADAPPVVTQVQPESDVGGHASGEADPATRSVHADASEWIDMPAVHERADAPSTNSTPDAFPAPDERASPPTPLTLGGGRAARDSTTPNENSLRSQRWQEPPGDQTRPTGTRAGRGFLPDSASRAPPGPRGRIAILAIVLLLPFLAISQAVQRAIVRLAAAFHTRLRPERIQEHPKRRRILDIIRQDPGIHLRSLHREVGGSWGSFMFHVRVLHRHRLIVQEKRGNKVASFVPGAARDLPEKLGGSARRVLALLPADGRSKSAREMSASLGVSRQAVERQLRSLKSHGLVQGQRSASRATLWRLA